WYGIEPLVADDPAAALRIAEQTKIEKLQAIHYPSGCGRSEVAACCGGTAGAGANGGRAVSDSGGDAGVV
ncbi:hypothetical protein E3A20_08720, partial [Planctomyces bekefii]